MYVHKKFVVSLKEKYVKAHITHFEGKDIINLKYALISACSDPDCLSEGPKVLTFSLDYNYINNR